jgi:hypothetical protein
MRVIRIQDWWITFDMMRSFPGWPAAAGRAPEHDRSYERTSWPGGIGFDAMMVIN